MEENLELNKVESEELLKVYEKVNSFIEFLDSEKEKFKTEDKIMMNEKELRDCNLPGKRDKRRAKILASKNYILWRMVRLVNRKKNKR